jgi:hypothetical protein
MTEVSFIAANDNRAFNFCFSVNIKSHLLVFFQSVFLPQPQIQPKKLKFVKELEQETVWIWN